MKFLHKVLTLIMPLLILSSCGVNISHDDLTGPEVTIETYVSSPATSVTESMTMPPKTEVITQDSSITTSDTETSVTTSEESMVTEITSATTTATTVPSSEEAFTSSEYTITDYDGIMYAIANVNVRRLPDADSDRVGHIDSGDKVYVTGIVSNGWMRVVFKNGEYFVNGRYLSDTIDEETTTATEAVTTTVTTITTVTTTTQVTTVTTVPDYDDDEIIEDELDNVIFGSNSYTALNYSEQKAVWLAYLDINAMITNATESEFRASFAEAMTNVAALGFNTVYVHVRAFGDSYYYSNYYPFTAAYSGTLGTRPSYDPLVIMVEEAHKQGLSFHAWINPMRTTTKSRYKEMPDSYTLKKWYNSSSANGTYLVYNSKTEYYWLSPAYSAVRELICNGVAELVSNYNIDAVHIDDYFYPTTSESFDSAAYKASGTSLSLSDWRRSVVSILVKEMYQTVKSCNSTVLFGISPAGNTTNNYNSYYADIYTWGSVAGYCDYIVPQIYYSYSDKLPFDDTLYEWDAIVTSPAVKLVCGIAAYKIGINSDWSSGSMLKSQVSLVNSLSGYSGYAFYRYSSIFKPDSEVSNLVTTEILNLFT